MRPVSTSSSPNLLLFGLEPVRAAMEYGAMRLSKPIAGPVGDGHPVVVFPGLASDQRAVRPLMDYCRDLGYSTQDWGRGLNAGPHGDVAVWLDDLADDIRAKTKAEGRSVSLIGWSLGGIFAREVAKRMTGNVRTVITIGSPFAATAQQTNAGLVYRLLSGESPPSDRRFHAELKVAPNVPSTSIYSRSDGVVAWQGCIQSDSRLDVENIEVEGSHCGLGWNTAVLAVLADRLAQPEGSWTPYQA